MKEHDSPAQIILYQTNDGQTKLQVQLSDETVWLTQDQIADLYQKGRSTITEHIKNIISEGELIQNSVCREFRRTKLEYLTTKSIVENHNGTIEVESVVNQGARFKITI
jgi:hypothetical protein